MLKTILCIYGDRFFSSPKPAQPLWQGPLVLYSFSRTAKRRALVSESLEE